VEERAGGAVFACDRQTAAFTHMLLVRRAGRKGNERAGARPTFSLARTIGGNAPRRRVYTVHRTGGAPSARPSPTPSATHGSRPLYIYARTHTNGGNDQ